MTHNLKEACRQLRLSGLAASLDLRAQEATSHQLPHVQFLELLLQDELNVRAQRQLERRKKAAGFRDLKPLEDFDWSFNPSIKRSQIFDLATGQFIRQNRKIADGVANVLQPGRSGNLASLSNRHGHAGRECRSQT